jgi:hypothetical protein
MTPADVWSWNRDNLGDAYRAALDPQTWRDAAGAYGQALLAGSVGPEGRGLRLISDLERRQFTNPRAVDEAKYILPDGRLLGTGDNSHEYIAGSLGYGTGDRAVTAFMDDTGAARINVAAALFGKPGEFGDMSLWHPPTSAQMSRLARYVNARGGPLGIEYRDRFGVVSNGAELRRFIDEAGNDAQ